MNKLLTGEGLRRYDNMLKNFLPFYINDNVNDGQNLYVSLTRSLLEVEGDDSVVIKIYSPWVEYIEDWVSLNGDQVRFLYQGTEYDCEIEDYSYDNKCLKLSLNYGQHTSFFDSFTINKPVMVTITSGWPYVKQNNILIEQDNLLIGKDNEIDKSLKNTCLIGSHLKLDGGRHGRCAIGNYNDDTNTPFFSIGNGNEYSRQNALEINNTISQMLINIPTTFSRPVNINSQLTCFMLDINNHLSIFSKSERLTPTSISNYSPTGHKGPSKLTFDISSYSSLFPDQSLNKMVLCHIELRWPCWYKNYLRICCYSGVLPLTSNCHFGFNCSLRDNDTTISNDSGPMYQVPGFIHIVNKEMRVLIGGGLNVDIDVQWIGNNSDRLDKDNISIEKCGLLITRIADVKGSGLLENIGG